MYVANRASDKITQLTDNVYLCRSGSVRFYSPGDKSVFMLFSEKEKEKFKGQDTGGGIW